MSLDGFQRAFADAVASPERCLALRRDPSLLDGYELDDRERRRMLAIVAHDGMSHNCTLYRANRLTPIARAFPHTCDVLGDERLRRELESFWEQEPNTEIEFRFEAERFAAHLLASPDLPDELRDLVVEELRQLADRFGLVHHP